jgi:hypothetical protein
VVHIGPKGGDVIGPIQPDSTARHHCFANHVLWSLAKDNGEIDDANEIAIECTPDCPPSDFDPEPATNFDNNIDPQFYNPTGTDLSHENLPTASSSSVRLNETHLQISHGSVQSPLFSQSNSNLPSPALSSASLEPGFPFPRHNRTVSRSLFSAIHYIPDTVPDFDNWASYNDHILEHSDPLHGRTFFHVRANSTHNAAAGLFDFLKYRRCHPDNTYTKGANIDSSFQITPTNITLSQIFSHIWCFRA